MGLVSKCDAVLLPKTPGGEKSPFDEDMPSGKGLIARARLKRASLLQNTLAPSPEPIEIVLAQPAPAIKHPVHNISIQSEGERRAPRPVAKLKAAPQPSAPKPVPPTPSAKPPEPKLDTTPETQAQLAQPEEQKSGLKPFDQIFAPKPAPSSKDRRVSATGIPEFTDRRDRRREKKPGEEFEEKREDDDRRQRRRYVEGLNTLTVTNLRKNFGRKEIVRGVGFSMTGGRVAGLLGPNGAGKTTIFYMIVGFLKPTTGDIKLNDISIVRGPMYKRARMGIAYLPQEASIFRKLSVEQNIWAILESRKDVNKKQKKQKLDELIEDFSIGRIRKQLGYTLSGGERRRTEIARALAIEPKFLLLDEPFAGIDPIAVFEIKQIIKHLSANGIGVLITDHNVRDTLEITTDAFIINQGVIVARGDKDTILANQTVRDVYLGSEFQM